MTLNNAFRGWFAGSRGVGRTVESPSPTPSSRIDTLSMYNVVYSFFDDYATDSDSVLDVSTYSGSDISEKLDDAISKAEGASKRAIFYIPSGSYTWGTNVRVNTGTLKGPIIACEKDTSFTVTSTYALTLRRSSNGSNLHYLANDPRNQIHIYNGTWNINGTGWIDATDIYRGIISPTAVNGGTYGIYVKSGADFSEGWSVRNGTFDGVSEVFRHENQSADQCLFSNLTIKDFDYGIALRGASGQNYTATGCTFENPRSGAYGFYFDKYSTGTIYNPQWPDSNGTVVWNDGNSTNVSIVEPNVNSNATLVKGQSSPVSNNPPTWQQGHLSPVVTQGGAPTDEPIVRADSYSGSDVSTRVENAITDLTSGGTVLIPGQDNISWNGKVSATLGGRDITVLVPWNTRINVNHSDWTFDVSGSGHFRLYGGFWHGQDDSAKPGWVTTTAPNFDCAVNAVWFFDGGSGIEAQPQSQGTYRIFDSRFHKLVNDSTEQSTNACIQIGGSGCSQLLLSHIELANTYQCFRFNGPIDDFDAVRISAHPFDDNGGAVFCDANDVMNGTWHNIKWEAYGNTGGLVFDNNDTSTVADAVEPFVVGGSEEQTLWEGTKPRFFPSINTQNATSFTP